MTNAHDLINQGLLALNLDLPEITQQKFLAYLNLLNNWNRVYNLTAITDQPNMVIKHLLDCLAVAEYIPSGRILDVGSGAGLPAIPLALTLPKLTITALDSNQKKIRFITQAIIELGINNLTTVHCRVENYLPDNCYDVIIARAFANLFKLVTTTQHLIKSGGSWLAMKGICADSELAELTNEYKIKQIIPLRVPYLQAERHLIIIEKSN